jgi:hypothetical protein
MGSTGEGVGRAPTFSKLCTAKVPPETESSQASRAILREGFGEPSNCIQGVIARKNWRIDKRSGKARLREHTLLKRPVRRILFNFNSYADC